MSDPRFARVPPLPDAGSSSPSSSGRRRPRSPRSPRASGKQGLTVGTPSATGLSLPVSGTVAQVQSAFSTPISKYRLSSGKTGYDNATAPEVDATVAPQIEGILGLDTLSPPQPSTSVPEASQAVAASRGRPRCARPGAGATQLRPGALAPTASTQRQRSHQRTGALEAPDLAQAYGLDPLYSSGDYGAGATIALLEMSGAGYSSSDISTFASCYGITLGPGQITQVPVGGGSATGRRHGRSGARHRDGAFPGAAGQHRGLRGRRLGQPLRRLQPDRQRRLGQNRQRQLDERLRGLRRPVVPELGEHALPGGGGRRAVHLRRVG